MGGRLEAEHGQEGGRTDDEGKVVGLRPGGKGTRHRGGSAPFRRTCFTWNGNNREELLCRKRAKRTAWLSMGRFWTGAKKRIIFGCKVLGAAVAAAETCAWHDSEMQEINSVPCRYMRVMLRGRAKTVKNGRVRQVVESTAPRALADSACIGGGGEESWLAGFRRCCVTRRITRNRWLRSLAASWGKMSLCEERKPVCPCLPWGRVLF